MREETSQDACGRLTVVIPEDSPLRRPPLALSRRQVLVLDGIRYAADMADIAYERLDSHLQNIAGSLQDYLAQLEGFDVPGPVVGPDEPCPHCGAALRDDGDDD
jgi:hypothetical protein